MMIGTVGLLAKAGAGNSLTLPTANLFAGWEVRMSTLVGGDVDTIPDVGGNGRNMYYEGVRPSLSTIDGHTAMRLDSSGKRMLGDASTSNSYTGEKTYYFVGRLDVGGSDYRAIVGGGGGQHWFGLNDGGTNRYIAWPLGYTGQTPPLGTLFQYSFHLPSDNSNSTIIDPNGTFSNVKNTGTFQSGTVLRLGSTGGPYYAMQGDLVAAYIYNGAYDPNVTAYITQEWGV